MIWPFGRKKIEKRDSFTSRALASLMYSKTGARGEIIRTGALQTCANLWGAGFSRAWVDGVNIPAGRLRFIGRALALTGNCVFYSPAPDVWRVVNDFDIATRDGDAFAYRLSVADASGPQSITALAGDVLHFKINETAAAPWYGVAPWHDAGLTSEWLAAVESAASELYQNAPIGSQVITTPEDPNGQNTKLGASFRGKRGRILLKESQQVMAAGGPSPSSDWTPREVGPNIDRAQFPENTEAASAAILGAYGVAPAMIDPKATAQAIREADRHLVQWTLQGVADDVAHEIGLKHGTPARLDLVRGTRSYDAGGRARAANSIIQAMQAAKESNLTEDQKRQAFRSAGVFIE